MSKPDTIQPTQPAETGDTGAKSLPVDVGVLTGGDRTDKLTGPLATTAATTVVDPDSLAHQDVIICDSPDRQMFRAVATRRLHGTPVLFRMRGDPFWGIDEWIDNRAKRWLSLKMLEWVDGCLAMAPHQARKYERETGISPAVVGLPKQVDEWPDPDHTDEELRLVSLTNATYAEKVDPLVDAMPVVQRVLEDLGGEWRIGSWRTDGYADRLRSAATEYGRIEFCGRLDAHDALERANVLLHLSELDVLPNAILEGLASGLPVVTNDHVAFRESPAPLAIAATDHQLATRLSRLAAPDVRRELGARGPPHIREHHDPERIGAEMMTAIVRILRGER